jgi:hypothetical protein
MSLVWDHFHRGGTEKLVMLAMADWCNDQGGSLHPSHDAVAEKCCISRSQAVRVIRGLVDEGYLEVIGNQYGGAPGTTKQYRVVLSMLTGSAGATGSVHATGGTDATGSADATGSTHAQGGVAPVRETGSTDATQTTIEPSIEPPVKKARARRTSKLEQKIALLEGVDRELIVQYLEIRDAKNLPLTAEAVKLIASQAAELNWTLEQAIRKCCEQGWAGFKASWVLKEQKETEKDQAEISGKPWYITSTGIEEFGDKAGFKRPANDAEFPAYKAQVLTHFKITPEMVRKANIDYSEARV